MKQYLHIGINWGSYVRNEEIHNLITAEGAVEDWFRYGNNCWIIYTAYTQTQWAEHLTPHIGVGASLIIYEVANLPQTNGLLPPGSWEWFTRLRY